ncbi:MAG: 2TM domain-containing protein [Thaumarchaeota archaeon]|nr:2TM domain-containing protein [Nitrososphaerota archaeon]
MVHLAIYIIINGFLWALWALIGFGFPWPAFPSLGWGIGLAFHFAGAWLGLGRRSKKRLNGFLSRKNSSDNPFGATGLCASDKPPLHI